MNQASSLPVWWPQKIVSGGQTGVDRAALDWAISHGVHHGGWCPKDRAAEDGAIPIRYALTETRARAYRIRTKWNVRDSDATLVVNEGDLDSGTLTTVRLALKLQKPHLVVQLEGDRDKAVADAAQWLRGNCFKVLNVAGPRESKRAGIYAETMQLFDRIAEVRQ